MKWGLEDEERGVGTAGKLKPPVLENEEFKKEQAKVGKLQLPGMFGDVRNLLTCICGGGGERERGGRERGEWDS